MGDAAKSSLLRSCWASSAAMTAKAASRVKPSRHIRSLRITKIDSWTPEHIKHGKPEVSAPSAGTPQAPLPQVDQSHSGRSMRKNAQLLHHLSNQESREGLRQTTERRFKATVLARPLERTGMILAGMPPRESQTPCSPVHRRRIHDKKQYKASHIKLTLPLSHQFRHRTSRPYA